MWSGYRGCTNSVGGKGRNYLQRLLPEISIPPELPSELKKVSRIHQILPGFLTEVLLVLSSTFRKQSLKQLPFVEFRLLYSILLI